MFPLYSIDTCVCVCVCVLMSLLYSIETCVISDSIDGVTLSIQLGDSNGKLLSSNCCFYCTRRFFNKCVKFAFLLAVSLFHRSRNSLFYGQKQHNDEKPGYDRKIILIIVHRCGKYVSGMARVTLKHKWF